jgi:exodeoxyribonuclease VII small subunit
MVKHSISVPRSPDGFNFGQKMEELETLVSALESDNNLDRAMQDFEQASKLAAELQAYLQTAENKIQTISHKFNSK